MQSFFIYLVHRLSIENCFMSVFDFYTGSVGKKYYNLISVRLKWIFEVDVSVKSKTRNTVLITAKVSELRHSILLVRTDIFVKYF